MSRFLIILFALMVYTVLKAIQTWPNHRLLAGSFVVPFFIIMVAWQFIYRNHPNLFNSDLFNAYVWVGSFLIGAWSTYVIFAIATDLIQFIIVIGEKLFSVQINEDRRELFEKTFRVGLVYTSVGLAAVGLLQMFRGPRVKKVAIKLANLPENLQKLRIVQISDLHIGPTIRSAYVKNIIEEVNRLEPNLIFVTGDLGDGKIEDMRSCLDELKQLNSTHGTYYITGNHEYYWNVEQYVQFAKEIGFIPLVNENKIINIDGTKLLIAGVTDPVGADFLPAHKPDFQKAMNSDEKADFKILLAHRPDAIIEAEPFGYDIQFSGHTHSGQYFPFNLLVPLAHKYYRGLNRYGKMQVYVNAGTGYWGPPNRLGVTSEISSISLVKT